MIQELEAVPGNGFIISSLQVLSNGIEEFYQRRWIIILAECFFPYLSTTFRYRISQDRNKVIFKKKSLDPKASSIVIIHKCENEDILY